MKIFTFVEKEEQAVGVILKDQTMAWNMTQLFLDFMGDDVFYANSYSLQALIEVYSAAELTLLVGNCINNAESQGKANDYQLNYSEAELVAPVMPRNNVIAFGKNYVKHIAEMNSEQILYVFTKSLTSVVGDKATIPNSREVTKKLDYEGELALVIGKSAHKVSKDNAYDHIFGYTIVNDISARNLQDEHEQAFLAKSLPGSCPIGPVIVTVDELDDPQNLNIITKVNGEVRQDGNTSDMMITIPEIIEELSLYITLEAGDVIATGTPDGVAAGMNDLMAFLQPGDTVGVTIPEIGTLTTQIGE